jgi:hypothetical protein
MPALTQEQFNSIIDLYLEAIANNYSCGDPYLGDAAEQKFTKTLAEYYSPDSPPELLNLTGGSVHDVKIMKRLDMSYLSEYHWYGFERKANRFLLFLFRILRGS